MKINFEIISEFLQRNATSSTTYDVSRKTCLEKYEIGTNYYLDYFDTVEKTSNPGARINYIGLSYNFTRTIESGYNNIDRLYHFILEIFKIETIESIGLTKDNFENLLNKYKIEFPENTIDITEIKYFRIEEEREKDRIILSIDPPTGIVRFAVTTPSSLGIFTAVHEYFYETYEPWSSFHEIVKKDDLNFWEKLSFPQNPTHRNNLQKFEIDFAKNSFITPVRQLARSFRRQIFYVNKYLKLCTYFSIQDAFGKKSIDLATERHGIEGKPNFKYFLANRIYCMPEYKMIFVTRPIVNEEPELFAYKLVIYQPLYKGETPESGYCYHDIIYESGK